MVEISRQKKYGFEKFNIAHLLSKSVLLQYCVLCQAVQIDLAERGDLELSYCFQVV